MAQFLLEMTGMQALSAGVNSFFAYRDEKAHDTEICNQITQATNSLDKINALIAKAGDTQALQNITADEISDLVETVSNETSRIQSMKKTFTVRLFVTIIFNILLVLFIAIQLLL